MEKKIIDVIMKIDWVLFLDGLTVQEKSEFTILRSALQTAIDSIEFVTGKTHIELDFPESYVSEKTLNFLHENGLEIDGSGFDGDVWIWFGNDNDDCDDNDYDYDTDDWSYDYWGYWHRDDDYDEIDSDDNTNDRYDTDDCSEDDKVCYESLD